MLIPVMAAWLQAKIRGPPGAVRRTQLKIFDATRIWTRSCMLLTLNLTRPTTDDVINPMWAPYLTGMIGWEGSCSWGDCGYGLRTSLRSTRASVWYISFWDTWVGAAGRLHLRALLCWLINKNFMIIIHNQNQSLPDWCEGSETAAKSKQPRLSDAAI